MDKQITKKQRRINTDNNILEAALVEFGNCGYSQAKLSNIAKQANISIGLIIQNFGSKEEMLIALIKRELIRISDSFSISCNNDWKMIFGLMIDYMIRLINDQNGRGRLCLNFFNTLLNGYDTPKVIIDGMLEASNSSSFVKSIEEGQKNNEVKAGNPNRLIGLFYRTSTTVLTHCIKFNIEPPSKDWFLSLLIKK